MRTVAAGMIKRSYVKVDRYGLTKLGRAHALSATDKGLLMTLLFDTDFRTWLWEGTLEQLAADASVSRNTAPKVIERLVGAGLIEVTKPFQRGQLGSVYVTAYDELVVPEKHATRPEPPVVAQHRASAATTSRAADVHASLSARADVAQYRASAVRLTGTDAAPRGREAVKERGSRGSRLCDAVETGLKLVGWENLRCEQCGQSFGRCGCPMAESTDPWRGVVREARSDAKPAVRGDWRCADCGRDVLHGRFLSDGRRYCSSCEAAREAS
jgi:predicted transcriptional regulator